MRARSPAEGVRQLSPQVYGPNGPDHDVIVIGGGCIGAGIARDAALRGLSVLLVEQGDLAAGASGSAAGIVHGAAGALLGFAQARLPGDGSPEEILFWQQTARHLLQRTPCLVPVRGSQRLARLRLASLEARLRQAAGSMPQDGDRPRGLAAAAVHRLLPGLAEPAVGGVLFDLWSVQPDRLVVANAIAAVEAGAEIQLGQRLEALLCTATG
ncbi:MAG: FAD-dependent oxidoreductase, partial [Deltaproteobacteria bacterium]|nr:FAD-dependent oxidoreductase [Deltaproteobacteria bacterium]